MQIVGLLHATSEGAMLKHPNAILYLAYCNARLAKTIGIMNMREAKVSGIGGGRKELLRILPIINIVFCRYIVSCPKK